MNLLARCQQRLISTSAYTQINKVWNILSLCSLLLSFLLEVDTDSLEYLQLMCQQLSMDRETTSELLSKKSLGGILEVLMKYTNNDVRCILDVMNELIPKVIGDLNDEVMPIR